MRLLRFSSLVRLSPNLTAQADKACAAAPFIGKLGKWAFAEYQTEKREDLLKTLKTTRAVQVKTAGEFLDVVFPMVAETMRHQCMTCRAKTATLLSPCPSRNRLTALSQA